MTATLPLTQQLKTLYDPKGPKDDFKKFWTPYELIQAAKALSRYNVTELYGLRNPDSVKRILYLVLLVEKYKPLLKDMLEVGQYFHHFPEDAKDEAIVFLALFDVLCRGEKKSLENELLMTDREDYKESGLKVVYMQVEKSRMQYYEQLLDRLNDVDANFVYQLLPHVVPVELNLEYPKTLDIWINKSKLKTLKDDIDLLKEAGLNETGKSNLGTYQQISILPHFYRLEISDFSNFIDSSHYFNKIFIPSDFNHCFATYQIVTELRKGHFENGIVIQTHVLSLSATAYLAYVLNITFSQPVKLLVYGADKMKRSYESYFDLLGLKNVTVIHERFYVINPRHKDISKTLCVLVNPETTFDPSLNIIDETINRGCDIVFMKSVCEMFHENGVINSLFLVQYTHDLKEFAKRDLQRALTIPNVKFVVYQSFDKNETLSNNLGLDVVQYKSECSHVSESSVTSGINTTANYRYLRKLDMCFKQGKTPKDIIDSEIWDSDPPFVTFFHRTKAKNMKSKTGTEEERKHKAALLKKQLTIPNIYQKFQYRQKIQARVMPSTINTIPPKHAKAVKRSGSFAYPGGTERTKVLYPAQQGSIFLRNILEEAKSPAKKEKYSIPLTPVEKVEKNVKMKKHNIRIQKRKLGLMDKLEAPAQKEPVHLKKNTEPEIEHSDSISSVFLEKETKYSNKQNYRRSLKKNLTTEKEQTLLLAQQESADIKHILDIKKNDEKNIKYKKNQNNFDERKEISLKKKKKNLKDMNIKNEILRRIMQKLAQLEQNISTKKKKTHPKLPTKQERKISKQPKDKIESKKFLVKKAAHDIDMFAAAMNQSDAYIDSVANKTDQERNTTGNEISKIASKKGPRPKNHLNNSLEMVFHPNVSSIDSIRQLNYKSDVHNVEMFVAMMNQTDATIVPVGNKSDQENTTDDKTDKNASMTDQSPKTDLKDSSEKVSDLKDSSKVSINAKAQVLDHSLLSVSRTSFKEEERDMERPYSKEEEVTLVNKLMSWFRRLESKDLGPRSTSFGIRRSTRKSSFPFRFTTDFDDETEGSEEFKQEVEEETTDQEEIPAMFTDYHIPNTPAIRKRMKLFQEGERDIDKLLCPEGAEDIYVDSDKSVLDHVERKTSEDIKIEKEHREFFLKNERKNKIKDYDSLSSGEKKCTVESVPIEKDFFKKLNAMINSVFEPDGEKGDQFDDTDSVIEESSPPESEVVVIKPLIDPENLQPFISSLERQYLPPSEIQSRLGMEIQKWREEVRRRKKEAEDRKKEEEEEELRREEERNKKMQLKSHQWRLVDVIPNRTPTEGLSTLAKELYELRDAFEYYLNSDAEPLDWRVMIDRRVEE